MAYKSRLPHLVFVTDGFPYGFGEKSFVGPELEALVGSYRVTLVAFASNELASQQEFTSTLPKEVELITCERPPYHGLRALTYLPYVLGCVFSRTFLSELRQLFADGFSASRLLDSVKQYAVAAYFRSFCKRAGLFDNAETTTYYTFWFGAQLLAFVLEQERLHCMRIVSRAHGYDLYNERNRHGRQPFQRVKRDACARILFVASASRDYFVKAFGQELFSGQYVVNRLGVLRNLDCEQFQFRNELGPESPFMLISCSSVIPLKRVELIADALGYLCDLNIRWIHFGDGPLLDEIRRKVSKKDIRVEFRGYTPNQEILAYYGTHRPGCFILVSESEGGPVCVQEALSFGMPIIVTDTVGGMESFANNGILLSVHTTAIEVAEAIRTIALASSDQWAAWSRASYCLWNKCFNLQHNKRALLDTLSAVGKNQR